MPPASPLGHARAADEVEQRRLAVVDVAHDRDDRRPRQRSRQSIVWRALGEQRVGIVELGRDRLVAHFLTTIIAVSWSST